MHLVNDIDLISSLCGPVRDLVPDLTDIVYAVVRCGVDLDHVHGSSRCDGPAHLALPAWASVDRMLTVHCLRKYLRYGRLSRSPCPAEQIRMPDTVCPDLIL